MNVNKSIFRTMKVFNLKTPYLKITSLNKEKKFNKNNSNNDINLIDEQKSINIIFPKNNELTDIKLEKMISPISKKRIKIMKDSETNTEPITEIVDNNHSNSNKNNVFRQNYKLIKSEESPNSITDKIISLQKKLEQHSNHSITYRNTFYINNNNLKIPEINTKFKPKNKRNLSSSMKNTKIKNNLNKKAINLGIMLKELKEAKNENRENKEKRKDIFFRHYNIKNNYTINNIFNYTNNLNYNNRNIISAISLCKNKDVEKTYSHNENAYTPLYNKLSYEKKCTKKYNEYNNIHEIINRNSLIKVRERNSNIKTMKEKENKKYNLRHKNIKFTPCIYNLFNVPVIENNNSLEETIKQQTVSNFNNKYNFKFKTKDPKEKEKIKNLFYFLKKNINLIGEKNNELQNYFFINNKNKLIIDDNKINNGNKSIRIKGVKIKDNINYIHKDINRLAYEKKSHIINVKSLIANDIQLLNEMK